MDKQERLEQLERLIEQATTAKAYLLSDLPFMPLQDHIHSDILKIGDFTIVDGKDMPLSLNTL